MNIAAHDFGVLDPVEAAELLLSLSDTPIQVYVVQHGGRPCTVRRKLASAMKYCIEYWELIPIYQVPGYWRGTDQWNNLIEVYELRLEQ